MTQFIGAEYLIANLLIQKMKNNKPFVSLEELSRYGIEVRRISVEEDLDAVFLLSRIEIYNAIFDFSDYFQCEYDDHDQIKGITISKTKGIEDLETRFVGFIPDNIVDVLRQAITVMAS